MFQAALEVFGMWEQMLFDLDDLPVLVCVSGGSGSVWDTGAGPL